ncbi:MAG: NAD-dependent epimerase/dehydratase family protein, partial [Janthinobacterium lividum]
GPADTFIDRLRKSKPLIVQGDGNSLWAACHVDDVARGFIATMSNKQCLGEAYNITGDEWFTWNTYHEQVAEVAGGTFSPVHIPTDTLVAAAPKLSDGTNEIFQWPSVFDNSKLKRDTDYAGQTISFKEGVKRTLQWMEENGKLADSDTDDYEDRLIAAWQMKTGELPKQ